LSSTPKPPGPEPIPSTSEPRPRASPITRPSKKRRLQLPQEVIDISDEDSAKSVVIEIVDSDEESGPLEKQRDIEAPDDVFNTNYLLQARRTVRTWLSDEEFDAWVVSREEFHWEQIDRDRKLPASLNDLSTSYVSSFVF
jgi:hypothetical protein